MADTDFLFKNSLRFFLFRPEKNFPDFLGAAKIFSDYFKTGVSAK